MPGRGASGGRLPAGLKTYEPLAILSFLWFIVLFLRYAFPPLFETIQTDFSVSNTETGLLFTMLMLLYASMQFPGGAISDRIGRVRTVTLGALLFSTVSFVIFFAFDFLVLLALAAVLGAATAAHKTVSINIISNRYSDNTGFGLGVFDTIGQFGGVTAPIVAVALLSTFGWRWTFVVGGAVGVLLAYLNWVRVDASPPSRVDPDTDSGSGLRTGIGRYLSIFSDRRLLLFLVVSATYTFAWNGVSAFLPLYLTAEKGLTTGTASLLYSAFFVMSLSQLLTGKVSDLTNELLVSFVAFGTIIVSTVLLISLEDSIVVGFVTLVLGVAFHGFRPVRDAYLMVLIPDVIGGGSLGIVRTMIIVIGATAPTIIGYVADKWDFSIAFGVMLAALLFGGVLIGTLVATRATGS